jgi:uncharacterized protein (DUF58 family)
VPADLLQPDVLARADALGLAALQVVEGLRVGDHRSPYHGFSVEFAQHREYAPGDDTRHIDWKGYARSDRYTIKQYEQETNYVGHLLVDVSSSMRYGDGPTNKLQFAKVLAASLAYLVVRGGDAAAVRLFADDWRGELPAGSRAGHVQAICRLLEAAAAGDKTGVRPLLERFAERVHRRGIVFLITDCLTPAAELLAGLNHLRFRGHEVVLFHLLHRDEEEFPLDGNVRFVDLEGTEQIRARPHLLRPAYLEAMNAHLKELTAGCDRNRVGYVRLRTDRPLAPALAAYLIRRREAGRR